MKLHPRTMPVQAAEAEMGQTLLDFQQRHELTDVEMLGALCAVQQRILKYALRAERHPDDPDRPADQAPPEGV